MTCARTRMHNCHSLKEIDSAIGTLVNVLRRADLKLEVGLQKFVCTVYEPLMNKLTWDAKPGEGELPNDFKARENVLNLQSNRSRFCARALSIVSAIAVTRRRSSVRVSSSPRMWPAALMCMLISVVPSTRSMPLLVARPPSSNSCSCTSQASRLK